LRKRKNPQRILFKDYRKDTPSVFGGEEGRRGRMISLDALVLMADAAW